MTKLVPEALERLKGMSHRWQGTSLLPKSGQYTCLQSFNLDILPEGDSTFLDSNAVDEGDVKVILQLRSRPNRCDDLRVWIFQKYLNRAKFTCHTAR